MMGILMACRSATERGRAPGWTVGAVPTRLWGLESRDMRGALHG